ncbi:MAG: hypothetical protein J0H98_02490 [Solirubrobacterales bacterium]|nr:hypothetical protein [Solirubrobacterales bacterium]
MIRICLGVLALSALSIGLPASFAPETFYTDYPFYTALVKLLPPYNEHLVTDVGGLYLGFAVMLTWATIKPSRQLIIPLCAGWIVAEALHFAFHIGHLTGFTTTDAIGQTIGLGLYVVIAIIPIAMLKRQ